MSERVAIAICGSAEQRFLPGMLAEIRDLHENGYITYVASALEPPDSDLEAIDYLYGTSDSEVDRMFEDLGSLNHDSDLFVLGTGHGGRTDNDESGTLGLPDGADEGVIIRLSELNVARRIFVFSQCFSGNLRWLAETPPIPTLLIAGGQRGELTRGQTFLELFSSSNVKDSDGNGYVGIEDRFAYAVSRNIFASQAILVRSSDYIGGGIPPFYDEGRVVDVSSENELEELIGQLLPGQVAFIGLSHYVRGDLEMSALESQGQYLFINYSGLLPERLYEFSDNSIIAVDGQGNVMPITDAERPVEELAYLEVPRAEQLSRALQDLRYAGDENTRQIALHQIERILDMLVLSAEEQTSAIPTFVNYFGSVTNLPLSLALVLLNNINNLGDLDSCIIVDILTELMEHPNLTVRRLAFQNAAGYLYDNRVSECYFPMLQVASDNLESEDSNISSNAIYIWGMFWWNGWRGAAEISSSFLERFGELVRNPDTRLPALRALWQADICLTPRCVSDVERRALAHEVRRWLQSPDLETRRLAALCLGYHFADCLEPNELSTVQYSKS